MPIDQHGDATLDGLSIRGLPKVSLHDHLDGGVRPATIIELADAIGLEVPESDADDLADWFAEKSDSGSLVEYLKTFDLTTVRGSLRSSRHAGWLTWNTWSPLNEATAASKVIVPIFRQPVMSRPWNNTRPALGSTRPLIRL